MTEFLIQPQRGAAVLPTAAEQLTAGTLEAYSVRSTGTTRHRALYPLDTVDRQTAEWINDQLDDDGAGRSVASVAKELHVSTAAVRRILESLELTEEIENGEWDDVWAMLLTDDEPAVAAITVTDNLTVTVA